MSSSGLSRQDTLPAEDPSWSHSLPPHNEPLLYIPNTLDDSNVPATASYLKNLQLNVHLPSMASENNLYDTRTTDGTTGIRAERLMASATIVQENYLGKLAIPQGSFGPKPPFVLDDSKSSALPLSAAMVLLAIHDTSPLTSGVVASPRPMSNASSQKKTDRGRFVT